LVFFLDHAKSKRLVPQDPCLFCKDVEFKVRALIGTAFGGAGAYCFHSVCPAVSNICTCKLSCILNGNSSKLYILGDCLITMYEELCVITKV